MTISVFRIIEEVIFKSCPTPLGKKQRAAPTDMKTNDRVEKIINDLFEFGVSIEVLFDVDDLVKAKNIPKVGEIKTIFSRQNFKSYPYLQRAKEKVKLELRLQLSQANFAAFAKYLSGSL